MLTAKINHGAPVSKGSAFETKEVRMFRIGDGVAITQELWLLGVLLLSPGEEGLVVDVHTHEPSVEVEFSALGDHSPIRVDTRLLVKASRAS